MKIRTPLLHAITLASGLALSPILAHADEDRSGFFVGGHYGQYKADGEDFDDDSDFYDVVIGGMFNPYLGIEGGYSDFGEFGGNIASADLNGMHIAGILRLPLGKSAGVYLKGGQFFWESTVRAEALGAVYKEDIEGDEPFYGVGVDFFVTDNFNIELEYLRYKVDLNDSDLPDLVDDYETDIDTAKVGARFFF